jgi:hypothetical protein
MPIPQIQSAFNGWESPITMVKLTSSIVDYEKVSVREEIKFKGVVQPLTPEALKLKPLESRSWEWLMIHCKDGTAISTNDLIEFEGQEFKVEFRNRYKLNGFFEYHLVKNYE